MEGSSPWVYPDRSALNGLQLLLSFDQSDPLVIVIHEGRLLTPNALQGESRLAEAFAELDGLGVTMNQRARTAFLSLSVQEQTEVLEAVGQLAVLQVAEWPTEMATSLGDKPVYLLKVSKDLRVFLRVVEEHPEQQIEFFDVVREATLQAFLNRYRATSVAP